MATTMTQFPPQTDRMTAEERKVILASSVGTVFEWYDFYIYGTLATILAKQFFSGVEPQAAFIFTLLAFAAGFAVRPFGALFLLIALRLLQGLALGGEYGGAAIYVAEHAPKGKRGLYTSWIQTTATLGLFVALLLVLGVRTYLGEDAFGAWGWRVPFLVSIVLLAVSLWIRLQLNESPLFLKMKEEGKRSKAPLREAFGPWRYARIAILALLGATAGEAVVWYGGQFYALFFLTTTLSVKATMAQIMIAIALALGTPFFILFGWLSDKIGRKPIILAGFALAALTYFPIFHAITHYANPALEAALASSPVTVTADPSECAFQFNPVGTSKFKSSCDIVKSGLARLSVNYKNVVAAPGTTASVQIGDEIIAADAPDFAKVLKASVVKHGYPASADPAKIDSTMPVVMLTLLVIYVTLVYAPIAAWLVELFPTRIRYSGLSLPYHIGNGWFGGFLPATVFAIVASTGNIYSGLWYPIVIAAGSLVIGMIFLPETRNVDITKN